MTKIVINNCFGGFGLSEEAMQAYAARKGLTLYPEKDVLFTRYWTVPPEQRVAEVSSEQWLKMTGVERIAQDKAYTSQTISDIDFNRDDPDLVAVVEKLGEQANHQFANLRVIEIPDDIEWQIQDYDGCEHVAEVHRTRS